ncbi:MAG: GatB/YqeY domain-containing protein [Terriglobales bacterium]
MNLSERIQRDMVAAMKERADLRLSTLRMMKAAVKNREVDLRQSLDDAAVQQVLATMIKQRQDSASQFAAGGRPELAAKENEEIVIIESYLPRPLSPAEVEAGVRAAILELGATSPKDLGKVMKAALARFQAGQQRVEGAVVSETARRLLGSAG